VVRGEYKELSTRNSADSLETDEAVEYLNNQSKAFHKSQVSVPKLTELVDRLYLIINYFHHISLSKQI